MILILYRQDIRDALAALEAAGVRGEPAAIHFRHILSMMEKNELQAVSVAEHG